jgi:hypothetical protein
LRDTWYADQRDLVKWGTLAHLAEREALDVIVQVPFLRHGRRPPLRSGSQEVSISSEVWKFFRDVGAVRALGERLGRMIVVVDEVFVPREREMYRQRILAALDGVAGRRVVLLDPDTGIEPVRAAPEHVTVEDIQAVWRVLQAREWLVLYQHASRRRKWREEARERFGVACGALNVEVFSAPEIAADVVFFAAKKTDGRASDA